ncbi:MAG: hypothetical protein WCH34_05580 [Bacteroidota bacterium]
MNDGQRIHSRMFRVVQVACDANPGASTLVIKFGERIVIAKAKFNAFLTADQIALAIAGGAALNKENARISLVGEVELGYDCLESWAIDEGDEQKQKQWHYPPSAINKMNGEELVGAAKNLKIDINTVTVAALEDYGYEASDLTDLTNASTLFEGLLAIPESDVKLHSTEIVNRDKKFNEFMDYVNGPLDKSSKPFKKKDSEFFTLYNKCRKLHLQGHRKRTPTESGADVDEYRKMIPVMTIAKIDFMILADKIYLISNVGDANLKWWMQESADIPSTVPEDAADFPSGDEITKSSAELDCPPKAYLFFSNMNNAEVGEVAVSEVI